MDGTPTIPLTENKRKKSEKKKNKKKPEDSRRSQIYTRGNQIEPIRCADQVARRIARRSIEVRRTTERPKTGRPLGEPETERSSVRDSRITSDNGPQ